MKILERLDLPKIPHVEGPAGLWKINAKLHHEGSWEDKVQAALRDLLKEEFERIQNALTPGKTVEAVSESDE